MKKVDYQKLSEQYAGFLVAVGGVSITVLTLVLQLGPEVAAPAVNLRSFLVAALLVATVTCFIGAHMMAETAAFIERDKARHPYSPSGQRLFVLASLNIFIAIILVLFALMLLPTSSGRVHAASLAPIWGLASLHSRDFLLTAGPPVDEEASPHARCSRRRWGRSFPHL